jgi:DNA-binding LytR/AlgR family response regulator
MINIAIVEDEEEYAGTLSAYISRYVRESGNDLVQTRYTDGSGIVDDYKGQYDIILMDIKMKYMDGMSAAEQIRKIDPQVIIIFITNMIQYAIKGYAVDALDYVLKPVEYFPFSKTLEKAVERLPHDTKHYLTVSNKDGTVKLAVASIKYIESQGHNLSFHTKDEVVTITATMKSVEKELAAEHFFRCNKGCLVNLSFVEGIRDGCAVVGNEMLPVSRARKNDFMEALADFL